MKNSKILLSCLLATAVLSGCKNMSGTVNADALVGSGMSAYKAATLSDADMRSLTDQACKQSDSESQIASASSKYTKRLNKIAKSLGNNINGLPVNYKVYLTNDVNAWAMANGCIRVYSGLMDMMTDNEIEGVLGHEMGHVALGHSRKAMQAAYATLAARDAITATGGTAAQLSQSQLGDLTEAVINSAFSREQESQADDFSYEYMKKQHLSTQGLATSFDKLAKLDGGASKSLFDSHPPSAERAQHIRERISADRK